MGTPAGVGGSPPLGPFFVEPDVMGMGPGVVVMEPPSATNPNGEIPIYIDPNPANTWLKRIVIGPQSLPVPVLTDGAIIPIWEKIRIIPPPSGVPPLPFTDWHEQIVDIVAPPNSQFIWGGGHLVIHDPNDPGTVPPPPPLVDVQGMTDPSDPRGIWFGPWPGILPPQTGLPIWIHKELIYRGPTLEIPTAGPGIEIYIREWPTTPEPTTLVLAGLGCVVAVGLRRRRAS
jgi:hypothetical protein